MRRLEAISIVGLLSGLGLRIRQFLDLVFIFGSDLRRTWLWILILSAGMPVGLILFLRTLSPVYGREGLHFLVAGNLVLSVTYGPTVYVMSRLAWSRQRREFDYFATLPVPKVLVVLAFFLIGFLITFPGAIAVLAAGRLLLNVVVRLNLIIPIVLALSALALCAAGAFLGVWVKDGPTSNIVGNVMVIVTTFLAPVLVPRERLPWILQWTSYLLPQTYAARSLRKAVTGDFTSDMWWDVAILLMMAFVSLLFVHRKLEWRGSDD